MVLSSLGHVLREQRDASRTPLAPTHAQQQRGYTHSPTTIISTQHHTRTHTYLITSRRSYSEPDRIRKLFERLRANYVTCRALYKTTRRQRRKKARTHRKRDYRSAQHNTPHRALAQPALLLLRHHYRVRLRARGYIRPVCVALRFILELGVVLWRGRAGTFSR